MGEGSGTMRVPWMVTVAGILGFAACTGQVLPGTNSGDAGPDATGAPSGTPGATFDAAGLQPGQPFAFVVNDVVQSPMTCTSDNWEFPPYPTLPAGQDSGCSWDHDHPGCGGVTSAKLVNTGTVPLAYYARTLWSGGYVPGVMTGDGVELAGVLDPGATVDITKVFTRGIVAILGRSEPFSSGNKFAFDEGTRPWPAGVSGSGGATVMHLAQVVVYDACIKGSPQW